MNEDIVGDDEYLDEFESDEEDELNEMEEEKESTFCDREKEKKREMEDEENPFNLSEEVLKIHDKNINGMRIIPNGHKLVIAGNDHLLRIFDFRKMNKMEKHYTSSISLAEGSVIQCVDIKKDQVVIGYGHKCYVYNSDSLRLVKNTIRGDMYLKDCQKTKGHTKTINCCKFHPKNPNIFISGSLDSTVRVWNLEKMNCYGIDNELVHHQCLKVCNEKHYATNHILCTSFNKEGTAIIIGCDNGQIEIRNKISNDYNFSHKADTFIKKGLFHKGDITELLSSTKNEHLFFSRSIDNTVKKWDMRNLKNPIASIENVPTIMGKSNICFYKNEKYIVIGTQEKRKLKKEEENYKITEDRTKEYMESVLDTEKESTNKESEEKRNKEVVGEFIKIYKGDEDMHKFLTEMTVKAKKTKEFSGSVQIYDVDNLNLIFEKQYEQSGIICTYSDDSINHLFLGTTDGTCVIHYDPTYVKHGVMQYLGKVVKVKEDPSFYMNNQLIYNMDNLPKEIKVTDSGNVYITKRRVNSNHENSKRVKMNPSVDAFRQHAYERKTEVTAYSNYIIDQTDPAENAYRNRPTDADNIVEVLRKREMEKKGKDYFLKAYEHTQPEKIIDYESDTHLEYSDFLKAKKCPKCGIRNCVCGFMKKGKE